MKTRQNVNLEIEFLIKPYALVGHRGFPQRYPENTMSSLLAAIAEGADGIEFDIQASKDGVPVVIHDDTLGRTTGVTGPLADYTMALLSKISAHEPSRLGESHLPEPLVSLQTLASALQKWPEVEIFAEVKQEVFARFSRENFIHTVTQILRPLINHCRIISFDYQVLTLAKQRGFAVGWVINDYSEAELTMAQALAPEFMICDFNKLPRAPQALWPGPWQWFVYDIVDPAQARAALQQGIRYLETWDIVSLKRALEDHS